MEIDGILVEVQEKTQPCQELCSSGVLHRRNTIKSFNGAQKVGLFGPKWVF